MRQDMPQIQDSAPFCVWRPVIIQSPCLTARASLSRVLVEHSSNAPWATTIPFLFLRASCLGSHQALCLFLFHCADNQSRLPQEDAITAVKDLERMPARRP